MKKGVCAGASGLALVLIVGAASGHVSERGLVLLLPTDVYTGFGIIAVAATIVLTVLAPPGFFHALFGAGETSGETCPSTGLGLLSFAGLAGLLAFGFWGPRDPLENLLPLTVFSVWWIFLPPAQAIFGDIWRALNPWEAVVALVFGKRHLLTMPGVWRSWPGLATFVLADAYMITDIAPYDPARLASVIGLYWFATLLMCGVFGIEWLRRGEGFSVLFSLLAQLSVLKRGRFWLAFPGHRIVNGPAVPTSLGVFAISMLALGSFDGFNETFWWMSVIGINPLEFPGRSAVIWSNRAGMIGAILLLNLVFAACVRLGLELVGRGQDFRRVFPRLALSVLPIALGYHLAHFLTSALVNTQHFVNALDDPLQTGASLLGLPNHYITTSFFNQRDSVEAIWLVQAGAIVLAHMVAVILSHGVALNQFGTHKAAVISQVPVAGFMVAYTLFGLWLLASPVAF